MDEAWIGSVDISISKAFTARAFDISTADLAANAGPGEQFFGINASNNGRVMIFRAVISGALSAAARWKLSGSPRTNQAGSLPVRIHDAWHRHITSHAW